MKRLIAKPAIGYAFFLSLAALTPFSSVALGQQPPILHVSRGDDHPPFTGIDWLTDLDPLVIIPARPATTTITIAPPDPSIPPGSGVRTQPFNGTVDLSVACCGIPNMAGTVSPGVVAGLGLKVVAQEPVNIPGTEASEVAVLSASPTAVPGDFTFQVRVQDATHGIDNSLNVLFKVLKPWPSDGNEPTCTPGLEILKLSPLNVYNWKATHGLQRTFAFGANSSAGLRGLTVTVHKPNVPLAPNTAFVTFKHNTGWRTGIRNDNSNNCAASGTTRVVEEGQTTSFFISSADTTTLVFSKPVCREWFIVCLSVGLNDTLEFSEGPFWTLFGGHQVDIETVGDWGNEGRGDFALGVIEPP